MYLHNCLLTSYIIFNISQKIFIKYEGPEKHISCLARHYFAIARKMLWSCEG